MIPFFGRFSAETEIMDVTDKQSIKVITSIFLCAFSFFQLLSF